MSRTRARNSRLKTNTNSQIKVELESGKIIHLSRDLGRAFYSGSATIYHDTHGTEFIIKKGPYLLEEFMGTIAYQALDISVPSFFLAKLNHEIIILQQYYFHMHDYNFVLSQASLKETVFMVAACALFNDQHGIGILSNNVLAKSSQLYKINNRSVFTHPDSGSMAQLETMLFFPQLDKLDSFSSLITQLILTYQNQYIHYLHLFFASFNESAFSRQLLLAFTDFQQFAWDDRYLLSSQSIMNYCDHINQKVKHMLVVTESYLALLENQRQIDAVQEVLYSCNQVVETPDSSFQMNFTHPLQPPEYGQWMTGQYDPSSHYSPYTRVEEAALSTMPFENRSQPSISCWTDKRVTSNFLPHQTPQVSFDYRYLQQFPHVSMPYLQPSTQQAYSIPVESTVLMSPPPNTVLNTEEQKTSSMQSYQQFGLLRPPRSQRRSAETTEHKNNENLVQSRGINPDMTLKSKYTFHR